MRRTRAGKTLYSPDANDPEHLVYRTAHAHLIKTNVRGEHGQHPDRVLIKKERRRQKAAHNGAHKPVPKKAKRRLSIKRRFSFSTGKPESKKKWASRPFPKGRKFVSP